MSQTANDASHKPHVVIIGGGFAGIQVAHALRDAPVQVTVVDRTNHSVFQPLLYQVATAGLAPDEIAVPIRSLFRKQHNAEVLMAEMTGIDTEQCCVRMGEYSLSYDYLVVATGVRYNYFGHDEWEEFAPSLKTITDAATIQSKILEAFEQAELETEIEQIKPRLTFVLVGGGPTGVELAGAIAELARMAIAPEFRHIDPRSARIVLIDAGPRILGAFPEDLANRSLQELKKKGVEVHNNARVTMVDESGVVVNGERIESKNVIWTAGVVGTSVGEWLGAETDKTRRVKVRPDLSVPGHPEIFVVGDAAYMEQDGKPLPGVAQVAMQQGRYVGQLIKDRVEGTPVKKPFRYWDKGNMATVGRAFAVADLGRIHLSGFIAWLLWLAIHVYYIADLRNRIGVVFTWAWAYFTYRRSVRVLTPDSHRTPGNLSPMERVSTAAIGAAKTDTKPQSADGVAAGDKVTTLH